LFSQSFPVEFCVFWPILKPDIIQFKDWFGKTHPKHCCKFSQDFKSVIRFPFGWCWIDFNSFEWLVFLNFNIFPLWRAKQSTCDQVRTWLRQLSLCSTTSHITDAQRIYLLWGIAVLAEPSDQNSGRNGQNSLNYFCLPKREKLTLPHFFIFFQTCLILF
jgi:hypothetical protein